MKSFEEAWVDQQERRRKASIERAEELLQKHRFRLDDLLVEHGLDLHDEQSWMHLAVLIAEKGGFLDFEWSDKKLRWVRSNKPSGRKKSWTLEMQTRLVDSMNAIMVERRCKRSEAARILQKSKGWSQHTASSLAARYSEYSSIKKTNTGPRKASMKIAAELVTSLKQKSY